jgi:DNA repair protein RadC
MQTYLWLFALCLLMVLLGIRGHVHADDTQFQLTLPLQGTAEESLQQLEIILTAMGAKFSADASHNHPSGEALASEADIGVTSKLKEAGRILGIPIEDHVIVGEAGYFSFRQQGLL